MSLPRLPELDDTLVTIEPGPVRIDAGTLYWLGERAGYECCSLAEVIGRVLVEMRDERFYSESVEYPLRLAAEAGLTAPHEDQNNES